MKKLPILLFGLLIAVGITFTRCTDKTTGGEGEKNDSTSMSMTFGGFESQIAFGEHLVTIGGCNDCHTPKKMTPMGPVLDTSLWLSGHPAQIPPPDIDRKMAESKGLITTQTLTAWVGPWGVSFTANLTSDPTGIGNWTEANFMTAIRDGKHKGISEGRNILPPMPWEMIRLMTDDELKAVFAYLKSTKPINNIVPDPIPPVSPPPQAAPPASPAP